MNAVAENLARFITKRAGASSSLDINKIGEYDLREVKMVLSRLREKTSENHAMPVGIGFAPTYLPTYLPTEKNLRRKLARPPPFGLKGKFDSRKKLELQVSTRRVKC